MVSASPSGRVLLLSLLRMCMQTPLCADSCGCAPEDTKTHVDGLFASLPNLRIHAAHNGTVSKGRGVFARQPFQPGTNLLVDDLAIVHTCDNPRNCSQDAGIAEGLREFLDEGDSVCAAVPMGQKKGLAHFRKTKCERWSGVVQSLYSLHPAAEPGDFFERYARYRPVARKLLAHASGHVGGVLRRRSCCRTTEDALLLALAVLRINSFTAADVSGTIATGIGLSLRASFFNHECRPNAKVQVGSSRLRVVTIEPIREGEEVLINYLSLWHLEHERRQKLLQYWGFEAPCDCSRGPASCLPYLDRQSLRWAPGRVEKEVEAELAQIAHHGQAVASVELVPNRSISIVEDWMARVEALYPPTAVGLSFGLEKTVDSLLSLDCMPERYRMLQWLMTAWVQRGNCTRAVQYAKRAEAVEQGVLPRYWPSKHGTLAVLEQCLTDFGEAQAVRRRRQELMSVLAGDSDDEKLGNWARRGLNMAAMVLGAQSNTLHELSVIPETGRFAPWANLLGTNIVQ